MYASDFVGTGLPRAFSNMPAGEAIQQGDLVSIGPDGNAYWGADPGMNADYMHPLVNFATKYGGAAAPASTILGAAGIASAVLSNGNYVIVGQGGAALYAVVYDAAGNVVVPQATLVAAGVVSGNNSTFPDAAPKVIALSGGGFAVSYCTATGVSFGTWTNALAATVAPVQAIAVASSSAISALCQISGGNIVIVGGNLNGGASFAIYSTAGAVVTASTAVSGLNPTNTYGVTVSPCGTGFVVASGGNNAGTYGMMWAVYSAAGAVITAATNMSATTTSAVQYGITSTGTPGGNAVIGAYGLNTNASSVLMILSSGAAAGTRIDSALQVQSYHFAMAMIGTTCLIVSIGASGVYAGVLNNAMGWNYGPTQVATVAGGIRNMVAMAAMSDGNYAVATNYGVTGRITAAGGMTAMPFGQGGPNATMPGVAVIPTTQAILANGPTPMSASDGPYWFAVTAGTLQLIYGQLGTRIPVGVASAAAASGGTVRFQVLGAAPLRLTFRKPYVTNLNNSSVGYGQKMSVIGNLALLNGIQSAAPTPLN